jgi:hypothetical protein
MWVHGTAFDDVLVHVLDWIVVQTRMAASDAALIHTKEWVATWVHYGTAFDDVRVHIMD